MTQIIKDATKLFNVLSTIFDYETVSSEHTIQVDFYPVKYSDGTISERLIYKTVTFGINGPNQLSASVTSTAKK